MSDQIHSAYIIAFIVEKNGALSGERIIKGPKNDLTKQLFAAARSMRWIPGKCHGKNVPMLYTLPIIIDYRTE